MHKSTKILVLMAFLCNLTYVAKANAATINASSCSQAAVQSAINSASNGDTVMVPAGSCTWGSTVIIPNTKGVEIIGAGVGNTLITGAASPKFIIRIASAASTFTRISGIEFHDGGQAIDIVQTTLWGSESIGRYRVDHCRFDEHRGFRIRGNAYGVIDNCTFYHDGDGLYGYIFSVSGRTGMSSADGNSIDVGFQCWKEPVQWGSAYFHYFEDNVIEFTQWAGTQNYADCVGGGKKCMRYNTIINGYSGLGGHDA